MARRVRAGYEFDAASVKRVPKNGDALDAYKRNSVTLTYKTRTERIMRQSDAYSQVGWLRVKQKRVIENQ
ncbi:MAG: hypothetical protein BroJett039_11690 [Chloroflexota bacterium]|nr:MAG: hypothetical protein BroJett039_11690 [Chloroflexota bacterium]